MNKRIDELMVQAGARFEFLHGVHYDNFQYTKFAELIVKECCIVMEEHSHRPAGVVKRNVKEHFGVKE